MDASLERAIALAALAHEGQVDKAGAPYILHPLRVMLRLQTTADRIVAVLHDVIEDCGWTLERVRQEGFSEEIVTALDAVSRRPSEVYEEFILRAAANEIGRRVKLADLEDNCDTNRLPYVTEPDMVRLRKYRDAIKMLQGAETVIPR